jgi:hypothetical protein
VKSRSVWCVSALLPIVLGAVLDAQAPALDVKMGLWEITTTVQIRGQIAIDTSKMTPEMKKVVEDAVKKVTGETYTNVANQCMNNEWLGKWVFMGQNPPGLTCTQTPTSNTRASLDVTITCTGEHTSATQMHLDALSPTSMKGTIKSESTEQGRTSTSNVALTGKWLGADCGSEK